METTAFFRRQAAFWLRLSDYCSDELIADHLRSKAAEYHQRALRAEFNLRHEPTGTETAIIRPRQRHVLVVEDNCLIASMLSDVLNEFGYVVIGPAASLSEATTIASTAALDGALIDVALGADDALPITQILTDRHIPFAFTTGAGESPEGTFRDVPALMKPFTVEEVWRILRHMLPD